MLMEINDKTMVTLSDLSELISVDNSTRFDRWQKVASAIFLLEAQNISEAGFLLGSFNDCRHLESTLVNWRMVSAMLQAADDDKRVAWLGEEPELGNLNSALELHHLPVIPEEVVNNSCDDLHLGCLDRYYEAMGVSMRMAEV